MHPGAPTSKCGSRSSARRWDRRCRPRRRRGRETDTILFARARLKGGAMTAQSPQVAAGADRSEERRVGKECVRKSGSRLSRDLLQQIILTKQNIQTNKNTK